MKEMNSWPDPATYIMLTAPTAGAVTKGEDVDNETNSYVPPSIDPLSLYHNSSLPYMLLALPSPIFLFLSKH